MCALILILQLGLLISLDFTESSGFHTTRAEPELDLECLNDFIKEMMCTLNSDQAVSCSDYSLTEYIYESTLTCHLKQLDSNTCECTVHVEEGFVLKEQYKVEVWRKKNLLFTKKFSTTESIKPKRPEQLSVSQTPIGNFLVAWDTMYSTDEIFSPTLISELTYYIEGKKGSKRTVTVSSQFEYELVGRNLESNSNYIVITRIRSLLNKRFSDYSDPCRFSTPSSSKDILRIIIPVISIILIISIFLFYYLCNKILKGWWDKIPNPKIASSFVKQVPNLLSFQNEFSPVHLESSKLMHYGDKIWPVSSPVDIRRENSLNSLDKDSSGVSYSQTGIQVLDENSLENIANGKKSQSTINGIPMSKHYYQNSDFKVNNTTTELSKYDFPPLDKHLDPIKIDTEYSPCTLCTASSGSENTSPSQFTPSSSEITVVYGYKSISSLLDSASECQSVNSSHNDDNQFPEKLMNSKNIPLESPIIPVENEYKDLHSLLCNSEEQQSIIAAPEIKQLGGLDLHTSPGIEIDCSYHRV
ncbi:interleukin 4 receptor, tandem duplicate 1 [Hemibagrus wyckioides]|nr:interleukin 4 receptor, tandem duplicate 1 [Hemibagrus wyckioides]XP_058233779.1 interleukin 4 receptor, tandem duplicate 1 [Hemibagrus wyckioides]